LLKHIFQKCTTSRPQEMKNSLLSFDSLFQRLIPFIVNSWVPSSKLNLSGFNIQPLVHVMLVCLDKEPLLLCVFSMMYTPTWSPLCGLNKRSSLTLTGRIRPRYLFSKLFFPAHFPVFCIKNTDTRIPLCRSCFYFMFSFISFLCAQWPVTLIFFSFWIRHWSSCSASV